MAKDPWDPSIGIRAIREFTRVLSELHQGLPAATQVWSASEAMKAAWLRIADSLSATTLRTTGREDLVSALEPNVLEFPSSSQASIDLLVVERLFQEESATVSLEAVLEQIQERRLAACAWIYGQLKYRPEAKENWNLAVLFSYGAITAASRQDFVPITARFLAEVALLISGNDLELAENSGREPVVPFGPLFVNTCDSLAPLRCHEAIGEFDVAIDRMREAALALKVALPQPDPELSQLLALTARMVRNRPEQ